MGTAQVQGDLWGAQARNWADVPERAFIPAYEVVFNKTNVGRGTRLLDVGCGAGLAVQLAAELGAHVTGMDASAALIEIARQRVPGGDFRVGEMEELPYPDHTFEVVSGFNSFQYAASPVNALQQARRVTKPGGRVAMVAWGRAQDCEHAATLAAVGACLPPPPPGAEGPFALSEPGRIEALMEQAGLTPVESGEVPCPFEYPDDETAWRAIGSAGPVVRAIRFAGEAKVKQAVLDSLLPYKTNSGGYRQKNTFRYVIASA
ncbi:MAG: class I SAM-dependent methyltransferase [Ktedonobacteraceae bacterium]